MKSDIEQLFENAGVEYENKQQLNEYVENISDDTLPVIITNDSARAKESILNCGNGKRWLYDRKKRFWIIGYSEKYIHQDMTVLAARNGFYPEFGRNIEREVSYFYDEDYMRENPYLIRGAVVSFTGKIEEITKQQIKSLLFDDYTVFILVQVHDDSGVFIMIRDDPEPIIKKLRLQNTKVLHRKDLYDLDESTGNETDKSIEEKINSLFENAGLENNESFSLPKTVPAKFFKITDNLNDVENWRVKILQNNSSENKRLGSFDSVGYIMVSLADNTIIPIARSDEHHRGYEIMDTIYQDEYNINSSKYYPIFCLGNNYPYNQDEALKMKEALAKLKSYGYDLDKLNVSMYYITKGEDERYVTGNDFLGEIESKEEQRKNIPVTPLGKNLVKALEMFSDAFEYKNVRGELSLPKINNAWRQLYNIGKDIMLNKDDVLISWFDDETVSDLLQKYKDGYITEENLMNLVFGFGGIRQKIHNLLRRYHFSQVLVDELGNVDEVVNMIGAI